MFVSPDPATLVEVALDLLDGAATDDLPALRAGIAYGPAVERAGDFYGHAVNLASRVTGVARAGSVLCTEGVRDQAPDRFDWSYARKHKLKGMPDPVPLYRARPLNSGAERSEADAEKPKKTPKADRRRTRASS